MSTTITSFNIIDEDKINIDYKSFTSNKIKLTVNQSYTKLEKEEKIVIGKFSRQLTTFYKIKPISFLQHYYTLLLIQLQRLYPELEAIICVNKAKIIDPNKYGIFNTLHFTFTISDKVYATPVLSCDEDLYDEIVKLKNIKNHED